VPRNVSAAANGVPVGGRISSRWVRRYSPSTR